MKSPAVDKAHGSFAGGMTALGAWGVRRKARQTLRWAEQTAATGLGLRICEIGPGRGELARAAWPRHCYWAIDSDPAAIARVRPFTEAGYVGHVPPLPESLPAMDVIVCENVLEHMRDYDEARALLMACHDRLRPGGCLVLRCPDIRWATWGFWSHCQDHQYVTTLQRATMLCREVGFDIVRCGLAFECWTGIWGWLAYVAKACFPWRWVHDRLYAPWHTSTFSKLAEKVPHVYVVARKGAT